MKQRIVPLGYALSGGIITINETEADTVREIAEQYLSGKSLKAIAEMLTAKHIEYMSGKTDWNRSRIKRIVEDKRYIGEGGYMPILTEQEYAAMQSIKAKKNTQKNVNYSEGIFTLNAPVVCPNCGGRMHRRFDRRRKATTWWQCPECKASVNISDEDILREARLYRAHLLRLENRGDCACQELCDSELFWNRIMMEHAMFIRGLLDPGEEALLHAADGFTADYKRLLDACAVSNDKMIRDGQARMLTQKFRDFKQAGVEGIEACKIRSIILPLLADHVLREANHYLRLLED